MLFMIDSLPDPFVCDPLGSFENGTSTVESVAIQVAIAIDIVPEYGAASFGEWRDSNRRKNGGTPCSDVTEVTHKGCNPIAVTFGFSSAFAELAGCISVMVVHPADAIVGDL